MLRLPYPIATVRSVEWQAMENTFQKPESKQEFVLVIRFQQANSNPKQLSQRGELVILNQSSFESLIKDSTIALSFTTAIYARQYTNRNSLLMIAQSVNEINSNFPFQCCRARFHCYFFHAFDLWNLRFYDWVVQAEIVSSRKPLSSDFFSLQAAV